MCGEAACTKRAGRSGGYERGKGRAHSEAKQQEEVRGRPPTGEPGCCLAQRPMAADTWAQPKLVQHLQPSSITFVNIPKPMLQAT